MGDDRSSDDYHKKWAAVAAEEEAAVAAEDEALAVGLCTRCMQSTHSLKARLVSTFGS
jgi:hypothetical protein